MKENRREDEEVWGGRQSEGGRDSGEEKGKMEGNGKDSARMKGKLEGRRKGGE